MPLVILHHLLNVFVQLANKSGLKKLSIVTIEPDRYIQFQFFLFFLHTIAEYNSVTCCLILHLAPAREIVDESVIFKNRENNIEIAKRKKLSEELRQRRYTRA
jgi:hypothetical protein